MKINRIIILLTIFLVSIAAASALTNDVQGNLTVTRRVGIGITAPSQALDVFGNIASSSAIADAASKYGRYTSRHYTNAEENLAALVSGSLSTTSWVALGGGSGLCNAATYLSFYTASNTTTTTGTERMRITSTGKVGIGTTSPSYPLTIQGNASGISIWASANISAKGYITRTSVWDNKYDVWDYIHPSSELIINDEIQHSLLTPNVIEMEITRQTGEEAYQTFEEEGISMDEWIAKHEQALWELKQENQAQQTEIEELRNEIECMNDGGVYDSENGVCTI